MSRRRVPGRHGAARAAGLALGVVADAVLGDPRRGHPVAVFGSAAARLEGHSWTDGRAAGAGHVGLLVGATVALGVLLERATPRPLPRVLVTAAATWAVLGGTSLAREGTAMATSLRAGDLAAARERLPALCGRDPAVLDADGLARAALESVAENTADAVVGPLVWGAAAGVPGLLGYRAVNTLDAMVGHTSPRYRRFGWAAAKLDDVVNVVPARLAGLLTGPAGRRTWRRDAAGHPSPNAGVVEASFAGALGLRLGGRTVYAHRVEQRPALGDGHAPRVADLPRAVRLSRAVGAGSAVVAVLVALAVGQDPERTSDARSASASQ